MCVCVCGGGGGGGEEEGGQGEGGAYFPSQLSLLFIIHENTYQIHFQIKY